MRQCVDFYKNISKVAKIIDVLRKKCKNQFKIC